MSYSSPDYAKKKGGGGSGGLSVSDIIAAISVPYYEPMMAKFELVLSSAGDLMMGRQDNIALQSNS